ncbi:MAG: polysaccharide biosynthesis C-terminal domain-containing protein, partial [Proteobacteria bacterium]|nr:polysaccharide biosynthesis C-terminal domain-containing protein [Pseudomonadota bacterium]
ASFYARSDTKTPLYASLSAIALNLVLKLVLSPFMGAAGLALATAIGALVNFGILFVIAARQGKAEPDSLLGLVALVALTAAIWSGAGMKLAAMGLASLAPLLALLGIGLVGAGVYAAMVFGAFRLLRIPFALR